MICSCRFSCTSTFIWRFLRFSFTHSSVSYGFIKSFFSTVGRDVPDSVAYRRSMFRPPSAVMPWELSQNACSFIGTVLSPVQSSGERCGHLCAFTFLSVKSDPRKPDSSSFRIFLMMQGILAEISLKHLKPNDFIYISGSLGSYEMLNESGEPETFYKVAVQNLNYVKRLDQQHKTQMQEISQAGGRKVEDKHVNRLYLWQLFFASPQEWWDNRQNKRNPNFPDFKHKDTKECLWLSPDDPPWVRRQLELHDSNVARRRHNACLDSHHWNLKDL
ncbi:Protein OSB1, mitochondrial [Apostasia shenzhenica]|uniref:Protein OSB1, mitochondrial n=1 Tax=Apostasia shenzhenica TaxID=1088818 RepID=A0A2I0AFJ2_9ASPA|nr:Protein OSB1, mitochondrial [Apostasia shenzhenica]